MTQEKFERATQISEQLKHLHQQKEKWETAIGFFDDIVLASGNGHTKHIDHEVVPFQYVKKATIETIKLEIDKLQTEFAQL